MTIAEISIQIAAVHEIKKGLADGWRICHPPNEEVQNPRAVSKQLALGMAVGIPDLLVFSPTGKLHLMEFKTAVGHSTKSSKVFKHGRSGHRFHTLLCAP